VTTGRRTRRVTEPACQQRVHNYRPAARPNVHRTTDSRAGDDAPSHADAGGADAMLQRELSGAIVPLRRSVRPSLFHYRPGNGRDDTRASAASRRARQPPNELRKHRRRTTNRIKTKDELSSHLCVINTACVCMAAFQCFCAQKATYRLIKYKLVSFLLF